MKKHGFLALGSQSHKNGWILSVLAQTNSYRVFFHAMDDESLAALTHVLLLRLAKHPLPHRHLARLWHVSLQELEDLHLVPGNVFQFEFFRVSSFRFGYVLLVMFCLLTGIDRTG